jgi:proteic killer suppression protein
MQRTITGVATGRSRRFASEVRRRAAVRLTQLHAATRLDDLRTTSSQLKALKGNRKGQYGIRINDQWRVCFQFEKGDAYDVEIVH